MKQTFSAIGALLVSAGILLAGNGLQTTLIAVRADLEGFSLSLIGLFFSSYFAGFIAGCLFVPGMVARAGHIRAFAALAAIAAASALIFALSVNAPVWIIVRAVTGFCFAGLYMIIESWINEKSSNENRGQVLAVYRIVDLAAVTIGQFLLVVANPAGFVLFSLVAILVSLSIVPVSMTQVIGPQPLHNTSLNLRKLVSVSPLAAAGAFAVGLANGAFWGIAPVFVQKLGYASGMVAIFMSVAIVAGALAQWPVGYISDLVDRRKVLISVSGACVGASVFLWLFSGLSQVALLVGAGFFGIFAMPLFGLCAAHANDHADTDEFVAISGGLLLVYAVGAVVGPSIAPVVMDATAPAALFAYTAAVHGLLVIFGLYRLTRRAGVPPEEQSDYVAVPRTTPAVFEFDPRSSGDASQEDAVESASA